MNEIIHILIFRYKFLLDINKSYLRQDISVSILRILIMVILTQTLFVLVIITHTKCLKFIKLIYISNNIHLHNK